jgi:type II secretory pathway pseudopilin PulG
MARFIMRRRDGDSSRDHPERGYALVGLLALATIIAIAITIAAPNLQQQKQRELEEEAIFRGEQVAEAIRLYYIAYRRLPTSLEQLLDGIPRGTKKVQILRPSATIDPLTGKPWRLVTINDPALAAFRDSLMHYNGGLLPPTRDPRLRPLASQVITLLNAANSDATQTDGDEATGAAKVIIPRTSPDIRTSDDEATGPFIGIASRSRRSSIITYYGIDRHDRWIFTPLFR